MDQIFKGRPDPPSQRRGIGRALLRHAIDHAGSPFTLEVLEGNEPAMQLYLSHGFRIRRRRVGTLYGNEDYRAAGFVLEYGGTTKIDHADDWSPA